MIQFSTSGANFLLIAQGRSLMECGKLIIGDKVLISFLDNKKKSEDNEVP